MNNLTSSDGEGIYSLSLHGDLVKGLALASSGKVERLLSDAEQDHRIRIAAARALGEMGSRDSASALCKALSDTYPSVKHEAIAALGKIGGSEACAALSNLLNSKSCRTRSMAARALIQISGVPAPKEENLELLMKLLSSGDERVKYAILQIGPLAAALLTSQLDDDSFSARQQAAQTLALHIRRIVDRRPLREDLFQWLEEHGYSAGYLAKLYSFRIRQSGAIVEDVENSGFDAISKILCGNRLLRLQSLRLLQSLALHEPEIRTISLENLLVEYGVEDAEDLGRMGRTLIAPTDNGCLAIKLCAKEGDEAKLLAEAKMQSILQGFRLSSKTPRPLGGLFRIQGLPSWVQMDLKLSKAHAICYIADRDYFRYLSDPTLSLEEMKEGMASCAQDLGKLAGIGLIHTSLIPLYHNRGRAIGDHIYRWNRKIAGRLDNWLESCTYPNLRLSGIADLEHIEAHTEMASKELQAYAGEHLFSMSLVLGSYFRRRGMFDKKALGCILSDGFHKYCYALAGLNERPDGHSPKSHIDKHIPLDECIDWTELARRMAEEMEGNKYMHMRGDRDAQKGPHLGLFNGPFPIPELIRAIHITSLFAILERQAHEAQKG